MTKSLELKNELCKTRADRSGLTELCRRLRSRPVDAGLRVAEPRTCRTLPHPSIRLPLRYASSSMKRLTLLSNWSDVSPYPQGQSRTEVEQ
jgi:hypothetical protein